jgi:NOL1/NOP2/fmu family ribosome biogenesis protein
LKVIHAGITLGEVKGKDLVPHHSLAMSIAKSEHVFPTAELSYEQAVAYLRKEGLVLDTSVPRGYVLVTYHQVPLGFVKNIGNRANNLYPQEWRIRSGYLPEEIRMLV